MGSEHQDLCCSVCMAGEKNFIYKSLTTAFEKILLIPTSKATHIYYSLFGYLCHALLSHSFVPLTPRRTFFPGFSMILGPLCTIDYLFFFFFFFFFSFFNVSHSNFVAFQSSNPTLLKAQAQQTLLEYPCIRTALSTLTDNFFLYLGIDPIQRRSPNTTALMSRCTSPNAQSPAPHNSEIQLRYCHTFQYPSIKIATSPLSPSSSSTAALLATLPLG